MDAYRRAEIAILQTEVLGLLLHEYGLNHKVTESTNEVCRTMGPSDMSIHTARYRLDRLRNRKDRVEDGRRSKADIDI